ncbi:MAG: OPT/YSL family transporter [Planctomycetota bacterium]
MSQTGKYRELTPSAIIGGVIVGSILNMGIVFAGLQIGFAIVGSTVGAIVGFGLLRGVMQRGSILEVNIFQTIASSVNTVNAGVIFTVPVLFLLDLQEQISIPALIVATMGGSILGVVMIIPLRKQIVEFERLRFPSAVGVAAILKSPGAGREKAKLLVAGIAFSATISALIADWTGNGGVLGDTLYLGKTLSDAGLPVPAGLRLVLAVSLLSVGAGYLAGRPGLAILYGTLLNFWFLIPLCCFFGWVPAEYVQFDFLASTPEAFKTADKLAVDFAQYTSRHVGIGMILGGAIAGIVIALPALKAAMASLASAKLGDGRQEEVSMGVVGVALAIGLVMMFTATKIAGGDFLSWTTVVLVTIAGTLWLGLAGLVVAQTTGRTDWSPLSGLSLIAIAIAMAIMGVTKAESIVPAVTVGAAICVATSMCADMIADLKTGYLVGGMPLKQQIAQISTCWIGPVIALLTVMLLWNAYGFGPEQAKVMYDRVKDDPDPKVLEQYEARGGTPEELADGVPELGAPQAAALEAAIKIVQNDDLPVWKYVAGCVLGVLISLLISPGLGVMVGLSLYLPFKYMIVFGIGGVTNILVSRFAGARVAEEKGVPIAAGLIVGDAMVGVVNAVVKVVQATS